MGTSLTAPKARETRPSLRYLTRFGGFAIPLNPRAASFINRLEANPNALGSNLGNLRLRPQGSIRYGELDEFGRPTGVQATITRDMIGTGTHANPSIEPPGWSGNGTLNNEGRGHLLGRQLGGSGDDARNLVTLQQNTANSPVMSGYEAQVRRAVEQGQTMEYSSTPIYNGSNPVPRGVTLSGRGDGEDRSRRPYSGGRSMRPPGPATQASVIALRRPWFYKSAGALFNLSHRTKE